MNCSYGPRAKNTNLLGGRYEIYQPRIEQSDWTIQTSHGTSIGYSMKLRSLWDLHYRGPKARGCVNPIETETEGYN